MISLIALFCGGLFRPGALEPCAMRKLLMFFFTLIAANPDQQPPLSGSAASISLTTFTPS